jgi:hypothetical protein
MHAHTHLLLVLLHPLLLVLLVLLPPPQPSLPSFALPSPPRASQAARVHWLQNQSNNPH